MSLSPPDQEPGRTGLPVFVKPGEVHWSRRPRIFKTVLGSCVSVCLWDEGLGIGGLNHFVLPRARAERDSRFGDVALPRLADALAAVGCANLVAKVFGGAAVLATGASATVGDANTHLALTWLERHRIPIVARRTGGAHGIVMRFCSATGDVELREITPPAAMPARARRAAARSLTPVAGLVAIWSASGVGPTGSPAAAS